MSYSYNIRSRFITDITLPQMIAGSDTTSNSSCAILFFIIRHPEAHKKLVAELEEVLGPRGHDGVVEYEDVSATETSSTHRF